jgi:hypothetical protein
MKGFVFTLDAIFSLIFAAGAIALLAYVNYTGYTPSSAQALSAASLLKALSQATIGTFANTSPYSSEIHGIAAGQYQNWPQFGRDQALSSGAQYGSPPLLLYSFTAPSNIIPVPVVGGGALAFASGNLIYVLNATTGALMPNYPATAVTPIVSSPLIYGKSVIFSNSIGYITALSTTNGLSVLWSSAPMNPSIYKSTTTPLEIEDNYLVLSDMGTSTNTIYLVDPVNGTVIEQDQTAKSNPPIVYWISYFDGVFYAGQASSAPLNLTIHHSYVLNFTTGHTPIFAANGNYVYAPVQSTSNGLYYSIVPSAGAAVAAYNTTQIAFNSV